MCARQDGEPPTDLLNGGVWSTRWTFVVLQTCVQENTKRWRWKESKRKKADEGGSCRPNSTTDLTHKQPRSPRGLPQISFSLYLRLDERPRNQSRMSVGTGSIWMSLKERQSPQTATKKTASRQPKKSPKKKTWVKARHSNNSTFT
ncbi:uncharacterized protein LOC144019245 [Festucalex cinctus]